MSTHSFIKALDEELRIFNVEPDLERFVNKVDVLLSNVSCFFFNTVP